MNSALLYTASCSLLICACGFAHRSIRAAAPNTGSTLTRRSCEQLYNKLGDDDALIGPAPAQEQNNEHKVYKKLKWRVELEAPPACTEVDADNAINIFEEQSNSPINDR
jgi:hypothetical protein